MTAVSHVGVVVPVHDEEELLEGCLASILAAAGAVPALVVVVLDACTDASGEIAARFPVTILRIDAHNVGAARRAGAAHVLRVFGHRNAGRTWIANTDADSTVPANWIEHQAALAHVGADVMTGAVRPDLGALTPDHAELWLRTHPPGQPNGNVHGANLGIRASIYLAAGGFAPLPEHEDIDLVARAVDVGAVVVSTDECTVETSARFVGRTPGGYAGYLRALDAELRSRA
ncbi:MAG: glycosyltransferase [Microbacterium sp.]